MIKLIIKTFLLLITVFIFSCEPERNQNIDDTITIDSTKIDRKVLIIGIDGFRSDAMQENISPFIYSLTQHNNVYYNLNHITEDITYSGPNWSSILTGVHMNKHNVTDNSFDNSNYNDYPPFFAYVERANSDINTASVVNWTPINSYTTSNYTDFAPVESMNDSIVFEQTKAMLLNSTADVIFIQFDELDGAGHAYGFHPSIIEYTSTVNKLDSYSETLFNIIEDKRLNGEDWIYMIVSDHGGEGTGHGDATNLNISRTIFLTEHPSESFLASCCYVSSQVDLVPTIFNFLGISSTKFESDKDGTSIINP